VITRYIDCRLQSRSGRGRSMHRGCTYAAHRLQARDRPARGFRLVLADAPGTQAGLSRRAACSFRLTAGRHSLAGPQSCISSCLATLLAIPRLKDETITPPRATESDAGIPRFAIPLPEVGFLFLPIQKGPQSSTRRSREKKGKDNRDTYRLLLCR
jgi:hypothetical protein